MIIKKQSQVANAAVGDIVMYTIIVSNDEPFTINNVIITDILASELEFVPGSLQINGSGVSGDVVSGVQLGSMAPNLAKTNVITFQAKVLDQGNGVITNTTTGTYTYMDPTTSLNQFGSTQSNTSTLNVYSADLDIIKQQDINKAKLGDIINYTITLYNRGDVELANILVTDVLSPALQLVQGSIRLGNETLNIVDLSQGINIPIMNPGDTVIITFAAKVTGGSCGPCIPNTATATAMYVLPDNSIGTRNFISNTLQLVIGVKCFKQIMLDKYLIIPMSKPDVEEINDVTATVEIYDSYPIGTPVGTSNEGQILTGNKLVINGVVNVMVNYTALVTTQSVHAAQYSIPFSSFIVLPVDYSNNCPVGVTGIIENIYHQLNGTREIYINIAMLLRGTVVS